MTIYIDDFHTIAASRDQDTGRRMAYMISDTRGELAHFARLIRVGFLVWHRDGELVRLDEAARASALLFGAVPVSCRQLAAMVALRHLGESMGEPETAPARRSAIARMVWDADVHPHS